MPHVSFQSNEAAVLDLFIMVHLYILVSSSVQALLPQMFSEGLKSALLVFSLLPFKVVESSLLKIDQEVCLIYPYLEPRLHRFPVSNAYHTLGCFQELECTS